MVAGERKAAPAVLIPPFAVEGAAAPVVAPSRTQAAARPVRPRTRRHEPGSRLRNPPAHGTNADTLRRRATMLQRHDILPGGLKVDRDWWHAAKLGIAVAVALVAAYAVHLATPLDAIRHAGPGDRTAEAHQRDAGIADHTLRVTIDRDLHDRAAAVLHSAGLDTDDAVRTLFARIAEDGKLPYRLFPPSDGDAEDAGSDLERHRTRDWRDPPTTTAPIPAVSGATINRADRGSRVP